MKNYRYTLIVNTMTNCLEFSFSEEHQANTVLQSYSGKPGVCRLTIYRHLANQHFSSGTRVALSK